MSIDTSTTDLCSDLPDLQAPTHTFTFTYSGTAEAPKIPLVPFCYGPFRVWRTLGEGGYAKAMVAQDMVSNRLLCLKVFGKDRLKRNYREEVFLNELEVYRRIASSIPCPASKFLMGLELSFQTKNDVCFAMDLMTSDLHIYMMRDASFCSRSARRWTAQIALGISALHQIGIIHRDIKPENILIDARQNVRIADFGLSYIDGHEGPLDREQVYTTSVVGTTYCMAPEILHNRFDPGTMEYGTSVDWWSLGCVVYQLVSTNHQALFDTKEDIINYAAWCYSGDRMPQQFPAFQVFPLMIADLIGGLLDPDPSKRYGFPDVVYHRSFVRSYNETEFSNTYSRALEREEFLDYLPKLQDDSEPAAVWHRLAPWEKRRVPNVDWVKPPFFSFS